jgi:hypothetical protein
MIVLLALAITGADDVVEYVVSASGRMPDAGSVSGLPLDWDSDLQEYSSRVVW